MSRSSVQLFKNMRWDGQAADKSIILSQAPPEIKGQYVRPLFRYPFEYTEDFLEIKVDDRMTYLDFAHKWALSLRMPGRNIVTKLGGTNVLIRESFGTDGTDIYRIDPKAFDVSYGNDKRSSASISDASLDKQMANILIHYRMSQSPAIAHSDLGTKLRNMFSTFLNTSIPSVTTSWSFLSNFPEMDCLMALLDYFFSLFPENQKSSFRAGTITTYMKDCSAASRLLTLGKQEELMTRVIYFAVNTQLADSLWSIIGELGKPSSDSAVRYMSALKLVNRSGLSASACPDAFLYLSIIAGKYDNPRFFHTKYLPTSNSEIIIALASLVCLYSSAQQDISTKMTFEEEKQRKDITDQQTVRQDMIHLRKYIIKRIQVTSALTPSEVAKISSWVGQYKERQDCIGAYLSRMSSDSDNEMIQEWEQLANTRFFSSQSSKWDKMFDKYEFESVNQLDDVDNSGQSTDSEEDQSSAPSFPNTTRVVTHHPPPKVYSDIENRRAHMSDIAARVQPLLG